MKNKLVFWFGLVLVLPFLMAACSGATPTPQTEEPKSAESLVTEEPTEESVATEEPKPTENVVALDPTEESLATEEQTPEIVVAEETTAESVAMEEPEISGLPVGEIAPEFTLPDGKGNLVNLAEELEENEQVVIVFYFELSCAPCMGQLQEIAKDHAKYEEKGAQVIAIAVQNEKDADFGRQVSRAQFPILADSEHAVAESYGVLVDRGLSTPSVFIINKDQQIVWSEISHIPADEGCGTERVPSQTILENLG